MLTRPRLKVPRENQTYTDSFGMFRFDNIRRVEMNKQAVVFGALTGLLVQIGAGIVMGMLCIRGNVSGVFVSLIVAALISAFIAGLVAAIISGCKQIIHGVAAVLVLALASAINNIFTGSFNLTGFWIGVILALTAGCLGAGAIVLTRHINSSSRKLSKNGNLPDSLYLSHNHK